MGVRGPLEPTLAELLGVLSLGIDLGLGQPMEHMLRQSVIGLELAQRMELDEADLRTFCAVSLVAYVGCHADSYEQARWFGDDIELRAGNYGYDQTPEAMGQYIFGRIGWGQPPDEREQTVAAFMDHGRNEVSGMRVGHCELAAKFATRLGIEEDVHDALPQVFERWDGQGSPGQAQGDEIHVSARLFAFADVIEITHRAGGLDAAVETARARSGTQFDPEIAEIFCAQAADVFEPLEEPVDWDAVVASHPQLTRRLPGDGVDAALETIADFVDMKSPYFLGHSRAVADLAAEAGRRAGLDEDQITDVRRAGLLHDLGRLGISNAIWDKRATLSNAERERVRMQPYFTERMIATSRTLAPLAELAAAHQERLDGSGYPRGLRGEALSRPARILAAADVYQAVTEPRPHRDAGGADQAAKELRTEARASRLDSDAAEAVLEAAGHGPRRRRERPAGLTAREVEVLALLARGHQSKEIAASLHITPKTVGHHIGHIYSKTGATNRVAASLFATEHGLV